MAKETGIKPEFLLKLKILRAKGRFLKNWKENKWSTMANPKQVRRIALNAINFEDFVVYAFSWILTEEGSIYWCNISEGIYTKAPKAKLD